MGDRGVGSGADLRQRRVDRHLVRRAGPGREHRGDPGSRGLDPRDAGPGPRGARRRSLRRPVPDRPGRRPGRPPPAAGGRDRRVPSTAGDRAVEISVRSAVPAGCGAGTSAAVAVALFGALARRALRAVGVARHRVRRASTRGRRPRRRERDPGPARARRSAGSTTSRSTRTRRRRCRPCPHGRSSARGSRWSSSAGPTTRRACTARSSRGRGRGSQVFSRLRDAAVAARDAVLAQDLDAFGRAMIANTDAQRALHPELVGVDARA